MYQESVESSKPREDRLFISGTVLRELSSSTVTQHVFSIHHVTTTRAHIAGEEANRLNKQSLITKKKKCTVNPINKTMHKVIAT